MRALYQRTLDFAKELVAEARSIIGKKEKTTLDLKRLEHILKDLEEQKFRVLASQMATGS